MKIVFVLLSILTLTFSGCHSAANSSNVQATQNLSPTETMKSLNEAAKNKDTAKTKMLVSKGTIAMLEDSAKRQNTTVDELLREEGGAPFQELPAMQNEKITGETATVEVKNEITKEWQLLPFVKESGVWKVALDKVVEDALREANEAMKKSAEANAANVNSPAKK